MMRMIRNNMSTYIESLNSLTSFVRPDIFDVS